MFYAQFVLSKKGPLSKIWLAAHWERKLSKAQIFETNVQDAVDEILKPKVKLSLRTTGHLLLGIVRIYSRKAKYVLADCNEAYVKIRMAFHPGAGEDELREREKRDGCGADDVPELINDFYDGLPDINDFELGNIGHLPANQSRIDDITMREDNFETSSQRNFDGELGLDDFGEREQQGFSNLGLEDMAAPGGAAKDLDFSGMEEGRRDASDRHSFTPTHAAANITLMEDEPMGSKAVDPNHQLDDDFGVDDFGTATELDLFFDERDLDLGVPGANVPNLMGAEAGGGVEQMDVDQIVPQNGEINGTQESFALEPLDTAALQQQAQEKVGRQRRKRRLVVDEYKNIKGDDMKANMSNYTDTMQPLDLAPPTKLLMRLKENGTAEKLFYMPGCADGIVDPYILKLYQSHLVLFAREESEIWSQEVRRDLEMVDNLDDDVASHLDDDHMPNSPMASINHGNENFGENEIDENQEPFDNLSLNGGAQPLAQIDASLGEEKRTSARRSTKAHEKEPEDEEEDDDEEVFTRRTKNILNSIAQKLRATDRDSIFFHDILTRGTRRTAAQKFYALLELHKRHAITVEQLEPFGPIEISAGQCLDDTLALTPQ